MDRRQEDLFAPITDGLTVGLHQLSPEDFHPSVGTILVVVPPEEGETKGGVVIPESVRKSQPIARVASVPRNDCECPVDVGDWVLYRAGQPVHIPFMGRKDLAILQYTDDASSEILGHFTAEAVDAVLQGTVVDEKTLVC